MRQTAATNDDRSRAALCNSFVRSHDPELKQMWQHLVHESLTMDSNENCPSSCSGKCTVPGIAPTSTSPGSLLNHCVAVQPYQLAARRVYCHLIGSTAKNVAQAAASDRTGNCSPLKKLMQNAQLAAVPTAYCTGGACLSIPMMLPIVAPVIPVMRSARWSQAEAAIMT